MAELLPTQAARLLHAPAEPYGVQLLRRDAEVAGVRGKPCTSGRESTPCSSSLSSAQKLKPPLGSRHAQHTQHQQVHFDPSECGVISGPFATSGWALATDEEAAFWRRR
jgi:hypothetical protein